ncbi:hypothetical protein [Tenacibaculum amylolyticum]|uniref:hypothetical protein n=1 Tax=Tenacibaculum amylolyticum TaxID=104269 RepID=UPI00389641CB
MIIAKKLDVFYKENGIPENGGEDLDFFELDFKFFSLKVPNTEFRKKVIHIHDIEHVLFECDTSWKGESFIAGWEIATGIWRYFPISFLSLWTMGFAFFRYPKEILKGYKTGLKYHGIIDLGISKYDLLQLPIKTLAQKIQREQPRTFNKVTFILWIVLSVSFVLFPFIIVLLSLWFVFV